MSPALHRRSLLTLLGTASLAGCSAFGSSGSCPFDGSTGVTGWPLPARDPGNTSAAPADAAPRLADATIDWTVERRRHLGPSVVDDRTVFLPSRRVDTDAPQGEEPPPALFAVDAATGDVRWQRDVVYDPEPGQATLERSLAAGHGHVYAVQRTLDDDVPNRLLAFDADSGERAWVHEGLRRDGVHVGAGVVLVRTDEAVRALDPTDGDVCRTYHVQGLPTRLVGGRRLTVRPAVVDDRLFVVSVDDPDEGQDRWRYWLHGVDRGTGAVRWTSDRFASEGYVPCVGADAERVYLPDRNRVHAFTHDGDHVWGRPVVGADSGRDRPPMISGMALTGGRVVASVAAGDDADGHYALDAATGEVRWHRGDTNGDPVVAGDVVYGRHNVEVGPDEYETVLHAIDATTGETRGTHRFDDVLDGPPRVAGGRLFVRTADHGERPNRGRPTYRLHALA